MKITKYLLSLMLVVGVVACGDDDDDDDSPGLEGTRADIQLNVANNIILPAYRQLAGSTEGLSSAIEAFNETPDQSNLSALRTALLAAWTDWQDASIFQFGPAEELTLRSLLNTYPTDEDQIAANISSGSYVLESIDNRDAGGFPALDFLINGSADTDEAILELFADNTASANRRQYLTDLGSVIDDNVQAVLSRWETSGDSYVTEFTAAEASGTDVGSSLGILVNALNLHFERFTRDGKIGIPAGVRSAGIPRPFAVEAFYGEFSTDLLIGNMQALRRLFLGEGLTGQSGTGLSDYLVELGQEELSTDILAQIDVIISGSQQLTDPLSDLIETDNDQLLNLFTEMQTLVVLIKTDMPSVMGVTITFQDNDGD